MQKEMKMTLSARERDGFFAEPLAEDAIHGGAQERQKHDEREQRVVVRGEQSLDRLHE